MNALTQKLWLCWLSGMTAAQARKACKMSGGEIGVYGMFRKWDAESGE